MCVPRAQIRMMSIPENWGDMVESQLTNGMTVADP